MKKFEEKGQKSNKMKYYDLIREKLQTEDIENSKKYKYNGKDDSICARLFLRRYWDYLIDYFPLTMAPNLITLIGFAVEVFSFLVSFFMSKGLTQPVPWWVCFLNGISVHIYQTLDNLDGRQARRTGNSSPLGQFFDHGCDAITGVLEMMKVAISFNFGNTPETYYFVFLMSIGFYMTAWEEYITHSFYLGFVNGPDEGLILFACAQILAGFIPNSVLKLIALNGLTKFLFIVGFLFSTVPIVINVVKQSLSDSEKAHKAIVSFIPALITIIIFTLVALSTYKSDAAVSIPVNNLLPQSKDKHEEHNLAQLDKEKIKKTSGASTLSELSSSPNLLDSKEDKETDSDKKSTKKSDKDSDSETKSKKSDSDSETKSKKSNKDSDSETKSKKSDKDSDSEEKHTKKSDSESSSDIPTLVHAYITPFFTMSASLVLQYQAQRVIVCYLCLRDPMRLFEITTYILWGLAAVVLIIRYFLTSGFYWFLYFVVIIGFMVCFDLDIIFGLSKGLNIPILHIKPKDEELPEDGQIVEQHAEEQNAEEFQNVPEEEHKETQFNVFEDK